MPRRSTRGNPRSPLVDAKALAEVQRKARIEAKAKRLEQKAAEKKKQKKKSSTRGRSKSAEPKKKKAATKKKTTTKVTTKKVEKKKKSTRSKSRSKKTKAADATPEEKGEEAVVPAPAEEKKPEKKSRRRSRSSRSKKNWNKVKGTTMLAFQSKEVKQLKKKRSRTVLLVKILRFLLSCFICSMIVLYFVPVVYPMVLTAFTKLMDLLHLGDQGRTVLAQLPSPNDMTTGRELVQKMVTIEIDTVLLYRVAFGSAIGCFIGFIFF
eukprot:g570.t1